MENGDYAKAYCLWEPLARLGHPDAQYHLGWLYANGNGINVDVDTAVYWWQQAANNGYQEAQFAIGLAYTTGEGIKADQNKAFKWFLKAAIGGYEDAKDIIKRLVLESGNDYYTEYPILTKLKWLEQFVSVTGDVVNIRAGAGTTHEIVYKAAKNEKLRKLIESGDWTKVQIKLENNEEITGWVYSKLVKSIKS